MTTAVTSESAPHDGVVDGRFAVDLIAALCVGLVNTLPFFHLTSWGDASGAGLSYESAHR